MIYKTEQELGAVIALGKPEEVINVFLESYLQGLEYEKWKIDKDLEVDIYEPIDVLEQMIDWKLVNYQILREPLYPEQSEYLDAVVKEDEVAIQVYKDKCLAIKLKYPKALV